MKRPLFALGIALCLGILFVGKIKISFMPFYLFALGTLFVCLLYIKQEKISDLLLLMLSFLLGALLLKNSYVLSPNHILRFLSYKSVNVLIEGVITSDISSGKNNLAFVLKAENLKVSDQWQNTCGRVLVRSQDVNLGHRHNLFYGDRLLVQGSLYRPYYYTDRGKRFNYRDYLKHAGIYAIFNLKKLKKIAAHQGNPLVYFTLKIRQHLKTKIEKHLSSLSASVFNAIILGKRDNLSPPIKEILVKTGTAHIIAISGLHLGIVAFITLLTLKFARIPRKLRYMITIFFLIIYSLLTGSNAPVVRATLMASILLLGYTLNREADILNLLSLAAIIILLINPAQLFLVSFQLSFMSVISIVVLTPKIESRFDKFKKSGYLYFLLIKTFSVSLAAWLGLFPLITYYFRIISPVTILANMIVVPYMTIVIACAFTFLIMSFLIPPLAPIFSQTTEISILFLLKVILSLSRIPFGHFYL